MSESRTDHPQVPGRTSEPTVQLSTGIEPDLAAYAREQLSDLLSRRGRPTAPARLHVVRHGDPAVARPVSARVVVDLDGTTVVVHADASRPREAVDLLVKRLAHRLEHLARSGREGAHGLPGPHLRPQPGPPRP